VDQAVDRDDFVRAPLGRYIVGRSWMFFYPDPHLSGFVFWGRIEEDDAEEAVRISPRVHAFAGKPHVAIIDARNVEHVAPASFGVASRFVEESAPILRRVTERLALVRPTGIVGTIVGGFFQVVPAPHAVKVFADRDEALRWLGIESREELMRELDERVSSLSGVSPLLRGLRALLGEALGQDVDLATVARRLNLSERSLQRRLSELGTTFQGELIEARIAATKRLLAETDASLTRIAFDVGFSSPHHLSTLFHKRVGKTPTAWRAEAKSRAPSKVTSR
jgi:AraC-like DNA-binding protein